MGDTRRGEAAALAGHDPMAASDLADAGTEDPVDPPSTHRIVESLLDRHGRTYASQAGIRLRNTPAPLFRLLCLSLKASARISSGIAVAASRSLADAGWTTPAKLAASSWSERTRVLNRSGYARYDESTATMLATTTGLLLGRYRGDLRVLRDRAGRDPDDERHLLQEFTGIGDVGAAIFSREVQLVWEEMFPFADERVLEVADRLGIGSDVAAMSRGTSDVGELTRLVAALVRCDLAGDADAVLDSARGRDA
jgi:hypothetical protein